MSRAGLSFENLDEAMTLTLGHVTHVEHPSPEPTDTVTGTATATTTGPPSHHDADATPLTMLTTRCQSAIDITRLVTQPTAAAQRIMRTQAAADSARCYNPATANVTGFLIDLDGTMYQPGSLLPGATEFFDWLTETGTPFVFLSNTGAKGSEGVQRKFSSAPYKLSRPLRLKNAYTAAEAQLEYLCNTVSPGSKIFAISGGGFWLNMMRMKKPLLFDSLDIRTQLTDTECKDWCMDARCKPACSHDSTEIGVFVVFFIDGEISTTVDPLTGEAGVADWSFDVIKQTSWLLAAGAQYVYTADDAFNPSVDPAYPDMVFPLPGPGMFAAMMKKVMYPTTKSNFSCCGKGGHEGKTFMMEHAIKMLQLQGHSGELSQIMMVGDRFDTDIRAGVSVGIKTCLVESGCHSRKLQEFYPSDKADFYAAGVMDLINRSVPVLPSPRTPTQAALRSIASAVFEQGAPPAMQTASGPPAAFGAGATTKFSSPTSAGPPVSTHAA